MRSKQESLPLSHEWLSSWWRHFREDGQLCVACFRVDGRLVGAAPFSRGTVRYRGVGVDMLRLLADGHSAYSDVIFARDLHRTDVEAALQLLLQEASAEIVVFAKVPETSAVFDYFGRTPGVLAKRHGFRQSLTTPIIEINGDWAEFLAGRSRRFRKSINNKLNRLARHADVRIARETVSSRNAGVLREIVEVSRNSWKAKLGTDLSSDRAGYAFLLDLVDAFGPSGSVQVWIARKGETPIAYEIHVIYESVVYPLRADFDDRFRDLSIGSLVEYYALKTLFDEGMAIRYHSCADDYWYLNNWTDSQCRHFDIDVFGKGVKPWLLYKLEYWLIPILRVVREKMRKTAEKSSKLRIGRGTKNEG